MSLPIFYITQINPGDTELILPEDTSRHISQVLRMQTGKELMVTDGKGKKYTCRLEAHNKKKCLVSIRTKEEIPAKTFKKSIAISPIKNSSRFEWFLEKSAELGIDEIIPIICNKTEKASLKTDRLQTILVSAMLQSQQFHLTKLLAPASFKSFVSSVDDPYIFMAHCREDERKLPLQDFIYEQPGNKIILIGPEGDFTTEEILLAEERNFLPVSLGDTRLRTETAGIFAAVTMMQK